MKITQMKMLGTALLLSTIGARLQAQDTQMRDLSAMEIAAEMAPGVNLWNTLDANTYWDNTAREGLESETTWGQPYTTNEMVAEIAQRGFKSMRVPVTWYNHMGGYPDYIIDAAWMDRVEEVVNYGLNNGLYVIVDLHHEDYDESHPGTWLCPSYEKQDTVTFQLEKVWTQIATRFKDYNDYLLFETMNEPRVVGSSTEWSGGSSEHREVVNALNLAAVNAIRSTGGNNETRKIMLPQVGANSASAKDIVIPNNDTNTIVSVHIYSPYNFCLNEEGTDEWGSAQEISALEQEIHSLSNNFIANGQAAVIGEWGAVDKKNYMQRINYYKTFADICAANSITPIAWMYSFNRYTLKWDEPLIEDAILQAFDSTTVAVEEIVIDGGAESIEIGQTMQLSAQILPDTASSQTVIWATSNKTIASVDANGKVTAKKAGQATIYAASVGGQAYVNLTVQDTVSQSTSVAIEVSSAYCFINNNTGELIVNCPQTEEYSKLTVTDASGRTVETFMLSGKHVNQAYTFSKPLNNGIYFVNLQSKEDQTVFKLIYKRP